MAERLSTDGVDAGDRFAYWREVICAVFVKLDAEPVNGGPFHGSVDVAALGSVSLSHVASDAQVVTRRPADAGSECLISVQVSGRGTVTQRGRTAELDPGDFALYDASEPYQLSFRQPFDQLVLKFPRSALIDRNIHIPSAAAQRCRGDLGAGAVASSLTRSLARHEAELSPEHRQRLGDQALDCMATALAQVTGRTAVVDAVRAADRQRALAHIEGQLHDPTLSVAGTAAALGVSTRHLQKLFADDVPLGERIRRARLNRAASALRDPLRAHHTIARIAADCGFSGPAQFSRLFRQRYGCTPAAFRAGL